MIVERNATKRDVKIGSVGSRELQVKNTSVKKKKKKKKKRIRLRIEEVCFLFKGNQGLGQRTLSARNTMVAKQKRDHVVSYQIRLGVFHSL